MIYQSLCEWASKVTILTIHDNLERDPSLATRRYLGLLTEVEVKFDSTTGSLDTRHPVVCRDEANLANGTLTRVVEARQRPLPRSSVTLETPP